MRRTQVVLPLLITLMCWSTQMSVAGVDDSIHDLVYSRSESNGKRYPHKVDLPLFANTHYLLEDESRSKLLGLLDQLLAEDVETTLPDPRARALAQQELWQLFDWTAQNNGDHVAERIALRARLARCIRRLALTKQQIDALSSGLSPAYGDSGPAPDVLKETAGWVSIGIAGSMPVAPAHLRDFGGRSAFGVFLNVPTGRTATLEYLKEIRDIAFTPTTRTTSTELLPPPSVPRFPPGTRVALLRRMMLIDTESSLICSPIVQTIQLRTFEKVESQLPPKQVKMEQFVLDRTAYLGGKDDALHRTGTTEEELSHFFSKEIDPFELQNAGLAPAPPRPVLRSCIACHGEPGIFAMNSFTRRFSGPPLNPHLSALAFSRECELTAEWKRRDSTWGLLRGYWENEDR